MLPCLVLPAGWFSLNVPSGLTLYWFVNNIISTAMQMYMKKTIKVDMPPLAAAGDANAIIDVTGEVIKPKEDREKKVRAVTLLSSAAICFLASVTEGADDVWLVTADRWSRV